MKRYKKLFNETIKARDIIIKSSEMMRRGFTQRDVKKLKDYIKLKMEFEEEKKKFDIRLKELKKDPAAKHVIEKTENLLGQEESLFIDNKIVNISQASTTAWKQVTGGVVERALAEYNIDLQDMVDTLKEENTTIYNRWYTGYQQEGFWGTLADFFGELWKRLMEIIKRIKRSRTKALQMLEGLYE